MSGVILQLYSWSNYGVSVPIISFLLASALIKLQKLLLRKVGKQILLSTLGANFYIFPTVLFFRNIFLRVNNHQN